MNLRQYIAWRILNALSARLLPQLPEHVMILTKERFQRIVESIYDTLLVENRLAGKRVTTDEMATALGEHDPVLAEKFKSYDDAMKDLRSYINRRGASASN
jgi:hypothetical protein